MRGGVKADTQEEKRTYQDQMNTALPDYININQIKIINTNKSQSSLINDSLKQTQTLPETDSDFFYISKIELSAKIFNGFKLSNTFTKSPILDA